MSDVQFKDIPSDILKSLKELKDLVSHYNHVLDGVTLKQQELMKIAVAELDIKEPLQGVKRQVKFDLESGKIIINDKTELIK